MSCTDCFNGCGTPVPDTCVRYTGADIPLLGVETGDPLSKLEEEIVNKLVEYSTGQGITLSDLTIDCDFIKDLLGCCEDKTLVNVIQALITASCTLKELVDALDAIVNTAFVFDTSCLTGLPVNPTRDDILQALLVKVCSMSTTLDTIAGDYVRATDLDSLISQYLATNTNTTQQSSKMVPFVAYEYYGPLSNFDGSGAGLSASGFNRVFICNGSNGTPDKRGRVAVGAVQNVPGGALDSAVDPSLPANVGTGYVLNQKFGQSFVSLNITQLPAHTHAVNDPGHIHPFARFWSRAINYGNGNSVPVLQIQQGNNLVQPTGDNSSTIAVTGITIGSTGGGTAHENRQPSIAANFIMYIP